VFDEPNLAPAAGLLPIIRTTRWPKQRRFLLVYRSWPVTARASHTAMPNAC